MQETNVPFAGDTTNQVAVEVENTTEETQTVDETVNETDVPEKEVTPEEQLTQLIEFRRNGSVMLEMTYGQFKKMRNTFKNDIPWKGPNQAYLLSVLMLTLEQALSTMDPKEENAQKVSVRNDSVEAMSVFINSIEGKSSHSAQLSLGMFLTIQQAISQVQSIDAEIKSLEEQLKTKDKKSKK